MGLVRGCDEEFRVKDLGITCDEVCYPHGIHVVDVEPRVNLIAFDPEVAAVVSSDNVVANASPLM